MRNAVSASILAVTLLTAVGLSQVSTGTINVQVQDTSGAVVPGASVILTHVQTGQVRQGEANEVGSLRVTFLPIGEYTIAAEAAGFKKKVISGLVLRVDQNTTVTVTLEPGEVREVVEVTGVTPLLEANTSSVGQVIDNTKILQLPLNGRNAFDLGLLVGNTVPLRGVASNLPFVGGGGRFASNAVMLDGVDNNSSANGAMIGRAGISYTPSVDAVAEFKVQTNNFSAEYGYWAGVVINATIRSGTNQFHGALFEFLRNDKLDANNFFSNATGQPKAAFRQNQFGGALGGRIVRDRTFFFMDYEGTRRRTAASSSISDVPPPGFRSGDFSSFSGTLFDPNARRMGPNGVVISSPLPNNRVPTSQLNPTSSAIMSLVPMPNYGAPGAQSRNYFRQVPTRFNYDRWDVRVDHRVLSGNNLFGRFSFGNQVSPSPGRFGIGEWIGGGTSTVNFSRQLVLADTHVFSPRVVNELRFGYNRNNPSINGDAPRGVGFANQNKLALFPFPVLGFPGIAFNYSITEGGSSQFSGLGGGAPFYVIQNNFQWSDNLNITRGNHTLKVGADIRRFRIDTLKGSSGTYFGQYIFSPTFTSSSDAPGSGAPFADFLLGFPSLLSGSQMMNWGREREIYSGTYFQDNWKVTRNLTLNLGIRYDLYTQPVDARDLGSVWNIDTGKFQVPAQNGFSRSIVNGDHNNWAPRAGFAYTINPKLVLRGGFGIFYGMRERNQETTQFSGNPPNTPQLKAPSVSPAQTVGAPYTLNTPITVVTGDPSLSAFSAANPFPGTIRAPSIQNSKFPYLEQANLSVQYERVRTWLLEVNFSAANGKHLTSNAFNPNQVPFSAALSGRNSQPDRPFPNISAVIYQSGSWGSNYYRAVNFKAEKRFSGGLSLLANYTISKNIESMGSGVCTWSQYGNVLFLDPYNPRLAKTYAALDVPQVVVVSYVYQLPWGPGRPWLQVGPLSQILGGWQINGITTLRSGLPNSVFTNVLPATFAAFNVPDRVSGVSMYLGKGPDGYLNPKAFAVPGTVRSQTGVSIYQYGNAAVGVVRGPGSVNFDFSVFKEFKVTERYKVQFRSEYFNLTNTPTFFLGGPGSSPLTCRGTPGATCTNTDFGVLSSGTATGRQAQLGLKLLF